MYPLCAAISLVLICLSSASRIVLDDRVDADDIDFGNVALRTAMEADAGGNWWQAICPFPPRTNKTYHFELRFQDNSTAAALLERDVEWPRLHIYRNRVWGVELVNDTLEWQPVMPDPEDEMLVHTTAEENLDSIIDFRREVKYVRDVASEDEYTSDGLEIGLLSGEVFSLAGGQYLPDTTMVRALRALTAYLEANETLVEMNFSSAREENQITAREVLSSIPPGIRHRVVTGATKSAMLLFITTYWAGGGLLGGGVVLYSLSHALTSVAAGMGTDIARATVQESGSQMWSFLRHRHELRLSASEKIFRKLDCHGKIKRCPDRSWLLVPESGLEEEDWSPATACEALRL